MTDSPISDEERDRFLRQIIANSPDGGISPAEQDLALREFIRMHITYEMIDAWHNGRITMGWGSSGMVLHLDGTAS